MNAALRDQLLHILDEGSTGCLAVSARGGLLQLFVMDGNIIAARSPEDDILLLRRGVVTGLLTRAQAGEMMHRAEDQPVADQLYEVMTEDHAGNLLFDRFRENVGQWLCAAPPAEFEGMEGIFLTDLHLGHDTRALLAELEELLSRTSGLRSVEGLRSAVRPGPSPVQEPEAPRMLALVGQGRAISEILRVSPWEELASLDLLARMLLDSSLEWWLNLDADEEDTQVGLTRVDGLDSGTATTAEAEPEGLEELTLEEELPAEPEQRPPAPLPATPEDTELREAPGPAVPNRLSIQGFHVGPDHEVADEELSLFKDADHASTGMGDYIKTAAQNREESFSLENDPVADVGQEEHIAAEELPPEVEVVGRGTRMRFSGPMLSDTEARQKIDLSNEVLRQMADAFDRELGPGSGRSQVQLLLEGSPTEFKDLFADVEANADGSATPARLLANLRIRPVSEHRRLLNRALVDLVMRGMDLASEHLSDDSLDPVAMAAASLEQRLGL